jgi:Uncharacterized conserved protein (DUF2190)
MHNGNISVLTLTVIASAAVAANRFVTDAGAYPAAGGLALGTTRTSGAIGDAVPVDVMGTALVEASAAIAVGAGVQTLVDGRAVTLTSGTALGRALTSAAAAGEVIEVLLTPAAQSAV